MTNPKTMTLMQSVEHLESDPLFLQRGEERPSGDAIIQAVLDVTPHQEPRSICEDDTLAWEAVVGRGQLVAYLLDAVSVGGQRQRGVMDGKHFDYDEALLRARPPHLEEPGASQVDIKL